MARKSGIAAAVVCAAISALVMGQATQPEGAGRGGRGGRGGGGGVSTTPPEGNDVGIRQLTDEEIPPNLNFYAMDPLYKPGVPLGWATERIEEKINRGVVASVSEPTKVYLGWRLLKTDPADVAFNVYRATAGAAPVKLNPQPLAKTTDFVDANAPLTQANAYFIKPVVGGQERDASEQALLPANPPVQQYKSIKIKEDVTGLSMIAIGDLDGDGTYDYVIKQPGGGRDPGRPGRNSNGSYKFDAYNGKSGEFMWRVDLGWNVDMGVWWTPFVVRDLDGDNKAELCIRGSTYAATEAEQHPDGKTGFVLNAPEYLIVYDGSTGKEIDRAPWIELGKVQDWADNTGNRASRHMMGVAYLDGKTPSLLTVRGTYGQMKLDAWTLKNKKLEKLWRWTNERAFFKYQGQGQHSIKVADIDGDGMDEILNGSIAIDNDGKTMWGTGMGHGDRFYVTDIDPDRAGLEIWYTIEEPHPRDGVSLWDAKTGRWIFGTDEPNRDNQIGGGLVADIDPAYPGMEVWGDRYLYTSKGQRLEGTGPGSVVWWDADLLREVIGGGGGGARGARGPATAPGADVGDAVAAAGAARGGPPTTAPDGARAGRGGARGGRGGGGGGGEGTSITKFRGGVVSTGIQGTIHQVADILGDWREELVTFTNGEIRIYTTTIPAADRRVTLMQDPQYRNDITLRTMGYPHFPQLSYYLGTK